MRTLTGPLVLAALLTLAACSSEATPKAAGTGATGGSTDGGQTATSTYQVTDDVSVVEVDSDGGAITVKAGTGNGIKVTETQRFKSDKPGRTQKVDGGELVLTSAGCPKLDCSISYVVELPSTLTVRLDSSGGPVSLTGLTGLIDVSSDGGALTGAALAPPELTARTGGGTVDVIVTQAPDKVDVDSGGGAVTLKLTTDGYAMNVELDGGTQSGDVKNDPASVHKVHVVTGGGNLVTKTA